MPAEAFGGVAVFFAGNGGAASGGPLAHTQAKGVGQADEGDELSQLVEAAQAGVFQVETPSFEILKALLNRSAPGVELVHVSQAHIAEKEEEIAIGQGRDLDHAPHAGHVGLGPAAHVPHGQPQVGHGPDLPIG